MWPVSATAPSTRANSTPSSGSATPTSSKLRGETLVREAAGDGLPIVVTRPSIVTGERRTGQIREYKTLYSVVRLIAKGGVRTIPGHYDALLDLVPVDYVADLIAEAARCLSPVARKGGFGAISSGAPR
ncbi:SDR family oxidoreductase [Streptomyces sp. NPDC002701]|uniref:SDR family oxidoreductase n=1 Tax=Streptomyces sp. NPDC002701 TaxID=3364661 RepID=UPI003676B091